MYRHFKRLIDIVASLCGLVILSPLLVIVAAAVWVNMGRPIFFKHERPGYKGVPFKIIKFRTMRAPKSNENIYLSDADRVTWLGSLLRNYSIDELPELYNVLKGDMSIVGPRPLLVEYLKIYTDEQMRRHDVKPGITGLAQVNGRQNITFSKRFEYDVWYVDHISFWLDVRILWLTLLKVFIKEGVNTGQAFEDVDDIGVLTAASKDKKE